MYQSQINWDFFPPLYWITFLVLCFYFFWAPLDTFLKKKDLLFNTLSLTSVCIFLRNVKVPPCFVLDMKVARSCVCQHGWSQNQCFLGAEFSCTEGYWQRSGAQPLTPFWHLQIISVTQRSNKRANCWIWIKIVDCDRFVVEIWTWICTVSF